MRTRFISLRTKLIAASTLIILFPMMGLGIYTYSKFEEVLSGQLSVATSERLRQININISQELNTIVNAANSMILDEQVQKVLADPPDSTPQQVDYVHRIDEKFLEVSTAIIFDTVTLTLFDKNGNVYTNWAQNADAFSRIRQADWFERAHHESGYKSWVLNHENYVSPTAERMVTLALVVRDRSLIHEIGTLVISKPVTNYLQILRESSEEAGSIGFIMDSAGNFLSDHPEGAAEIYASTSPELLRQSGSYTMEVRGEPIEAITNKISLANWVVVQVIPRKTIFKEVHEMRQVALVIFIISITVFIALIVLISYMFTKPIRRLGSVMKQVEAGDIHSSFELQSRDEIGQLGQTFNHMLKRLRSHMDYEIDLERSKEQAKLEALQAQINPHFLHNTLNTIKWMSMIAGTKDITEMLLSLSHLLNMSINRGQEEITLKEELENVRCFLTIQKYRFGDTITVVEDIDPSTLACMVPKLALQPLVENAYRHGLFIVGGTMTILSSIERDELLIRVMDEGGGPGEQRLEEIKQRLSRDKPNEPGASFSGIGMNNVHSRIQLMYGRAYGLSMERDEEQGVTVVAMRVPFRRGGIEHSAGGH